MSTATSAVTGAHFQKLMEGVGDDIQQIVTDNLVVFANDADTSAIAEKQRSDKLKAAYNKLAEFLTINKLNDLNLQQRAFLCTGAIGDIVTVQLEKEQKVINLLPTDFYESLLKTFSVLSPEGRPYPVYSVLDKFTSIAKSELISFKSGKDRDRDLRSSTSDNSYVINEWKRKMKQVQAEINISIGQMDQNFPKFIAALNEAAGKNAKGAMDILKKVGTIWGKGDNVNDPEKAFLKSFEAKVGLAGGGMAKWLDELLVQMSRISEHGKQAEEKSQVILKCQQEMAKAEEMMKSSPADGQKIRDEWTRKMNQVKGEITQSIGQIDANSVKIIPALNATLGQTAKGALDLLKNIPALWAKGDSSTDAKLGPSGAALAKIMDDMIPFMNKLSESGKQVEEKFQNVLKCQSEMQKAEMGLAPVAAPTSGPLFDVNVVAQLRTDVDTTNNAIVRAADTSPMRVPFTAARILLYKQFPDGANYSDHACIPASVATALDRIMGIHTNLFPRDWEGKFIIPPILIEPLRNFVDFFEDRFIMSFTSGETVRKGPQVSFNPVEVQVLRMCALFLTKDQIYDYRGDVRTGTFMGDYMGKVEKETKVSWTGKDKKFSLAATQSMQDEASRDDAIGDYIEFIHAIANNIAPPPKISKRKLAILLKYVLFDKLEKNIAGLLKLVAQMEPAEAKGAIMYFAKDDVDVAKQLIAIAMKFDPQASKMFSNNPEFAIARVFGR